MYFMQNRTNNIKVIVCPNRVAFRFIALLFLNVSFFADSPPIEPQRSLSFLHHLVSTVQWPLLLQRLQLLATPAGKPR
jgi:hypothetical protein